MTVEMSIVGSLCLLASMSRSPDGEAIKVHGYFYGWTPLTLVNIFTKIWWFRVMLRSSILMISFPFFAFIQLKVTWSGQQNKSFFTYDYGYVSMFSPVCWPRAVTCSTVLPVAIADACISFARFSCWVIIEGPCDEGICLYVWFFNVLTCSVSDPYYVQCCWWNSCGSGDILRWWCKKGNYERLPLIFNLKHRTKKQFLDRHTMTIFSCCLRS